MTRDLLWILRWLRKKPLFTTSIVATLALGIGVNTAVFSVVDAVLLRPAPYASGGLVRVEESNSKHLYYGLPVRDYLAWSGRYDLFEGTAAFVKDFVTVTGAGEPDQVRALRASAWLFEILRVNARLGRALVPSDESGGRDVVVLSDRFWRVHFHADPSAIGRSIKIADSLYTVVGVMSPDFEFSSSDIDLWTPLRLTPDYKGSFDVVPRIRRGLSVEQVQAAMRIVSRRLADEDPNARAGLEITVSPWREVVQRQYELALIFILAAVALVLLIACADVGGLLLSRAVERQKEIAIRASLGAGTWGIVRQLLAESLALAVIGSAAGIAVAYLALRLLARQMNVLSATIPHLQRVALDGRVLLFSVILCLALAVLCSVPPALLAAKIDVHSALRAVRTAAGSRRSARLFSILIASEAAFAFLLLVGSGLMVRSLIRLEQADHGFHPDHVLTLRVPLGTRTQPNPKGRFDTRPRQMAYYRELVDRLQRTPGIEAVAMVNNLPLSGVNTSVTGLPPGTSTRTVSPQYFVAMGIPLLAGRAFTDADQASAPRVGILNQYLARQIFGDLDPIGRTMPSKEANAPPLRVVGVVADSTQNNYEQEAKGELYLPYQQFIFAAFMSTIVVRTSGDPLALAPELSKEVWAVNPDQPIVQVETMNDVIADSIWRPRFSAWIFSILGALALLLTSAGVYSVIAYTTTLRSREVGIRVALGATPFDVMWSIVRDAVTPLAIGLAAGIACALALSRLLTSILYHVAATDAVTYWSAGTLLLAIGALASARPAWKAATGDPSEALRTE